MGGIIVKNGKKAMLPMIFVSVLAGFVPAVSSTFAFDMPAVYRFVCHKVEILRKI